MVPTTSGFDVVIVGAGHGGAQAAITLRQLGFEGSIALLGDEPYLPYERPPLSKDYLTAEKDFDRLLIRPKEFWEERAVQVFTDRKVTKIDPVTKLVWTETDEAFHYRNLIWSAGGSARTLKCEGAELEGVHTLRTRRDADGIKEALKRVSSVVIVGGGYIGLEAAAALTKLGKSVIVVEAQDRVLARVVGEPLSRFFENEHRSHGVDIRLNMSVHRILGGHSVTGVELSDETVVSCEMVIVGIGIVPSVGPLLAAGAAGHNGVDVDAGCRTSLPDVYAIGDCACHPNEFADGRHVRLESVQNSSDQANVVANLLIGRKAAYVATPWFWSTQYDLKLQTIGLSSGFDQFVVRGDPALRSFSVIYLKTGRVIALDCVNAVRDYVQGRKLVETRIQVDPVVLANVDVSLKSLVEPMSIDSASLC